MGIFSSKAWNEMLEVTHSTTTSEESTDSDSPLQGNAIFMTRASAQDEGTPDRRQLPLDPRSPTSGIYRTPILFSTPIVNTMGKRENMLQFTAREKYNNSVSSLDDTDVETVPDDAEGKDTADAQVTAGPKAVEEHVRDEEKSHDDEENEPPATLCEKACDDEKAKPKLTKLEKQVLRNKQSGGTPLSVINGSNRFTPHSLLKRRVISPDTPSNADKENYDSLMPMH